MKFQARKEDLVMQAAGDEVMIYDLAADKAYLLNETAAFVWQMCDGNTELPEITAALSEKAKQPLTDDIVKLTIDKLKEIGLMSEETPKFFSKTSRRKVIKQIGLATMVALPVIASLTAPAAAHAASTACPGGAGTLPETSRCSATCSCQNSTVNCCRFYLGAGYPVCLSRAPNNPTFYGTCLP